MAQSDWLNDESDVMNGSSLPSLSLTQQTSDPESSWATQRASRSLADTSLLLEHDRVPELEVRATQSNEKLGRLQSVYSLKKSSFRNNSAQPQLSMTTEASASSAWSSTLQGPPQMRKAVPLSLNSAHVFGSPAAIMPASANILREAGITVNEQLLGFHFDGDDAVEFEVLLSAFEAGSDHHILELNKCVGSSAGSSGGLLLGRLLQLVTTQLKAQGFSVQRHSESSSAPLQHLLSVPSEGTLSSIQAYSASTGLDLSNSTTPRGEPADTASNSGSDMLAALSKPGMDAAMLSDWSSRAARLPRWRSSDNVLTPSPSAEGTFQQRRADAAHSPASGSPATSGESPPRAASPRGYMFQAMRSMRSQDCIDLPRAAQRGGAEAIPPPHPSSDSTSSTQTSRAGDAADGSLPSAESHAGDPSSLWAPIRSMLVHGPAVQREEAVRVLASLSANARNHESIIKAKLPLLLARMMGLYAQDGDKAPAKLDTSCSEQGDTGTSAAAEGSALYAFPQHLSRVGRALALSMVENLSKSAEGLECLRQSGMLAAMRRLWAHADEQNGSFTLQPGAEVLFGELESQPNSGLDGWVNLTVTPPASDSTPPQSSRRSASEAGTEPPCPDVKSATHSSRIAGVLRQTRSALGTIAQEAMSNASLLRERMTGARDKLYASFASSKLQQLATKSGAEAAGVDASTEASTSLPHVPAQDERLASSAPRAVRWAAVAPNALPAAPIRAPLHHESSIGSIGSDGGDSARAAAIEAELATLPRVPVESVMVESAGTPSPSARRGSSCSERSHAPLLA